MQDDEGTVPQKLGHRLPRYNLAAPLEPLLDYGPIDTSATLRICDYLVIDGECRTVTIVQ